MESKSIEQLKKLKAHIAHYILNVTPEILLLVVKHAVSRFQYLPKKAVDSILNMFCNSLAKFKPIKKITFYAVF